jgi:hypothetical protein
VLIEWIAADPEHSAKGMTPDFFFTDTRLSLVLGGELGAGLFVRLDPEENGTIRLHIQFSPDHLTSAKTLLRGWPMFLDRIKASGKVSRLIFQSVSPMLIGFCKRCFGFSQVPGSDDYELLLTEEKANG